jgi:hypothetical protein
MPKIYRHYRKERREYEIRNVLDWIVCIVKLFKLSAMMNLLFEEQVDVY